MIVVVVALALVALVALALALLPRGPKAFLDPRKFKPAELIDKIDITHNTRRLRFALPRGGKLGLPIGQHISFKFVDSAGRDVLRSYTPVTGDETTGHVDFVIKVYPNGKMSQHVDSLQLGESVLMRGPKGQFTYERNMKRCIGMIAGGTGITPMYQIMKQILSDPTDKTTVKLIFGNVSVDDILLRDELQYLATSHNWQLSVHFVLDKAPANWDGGVGYVTEAMIQEHCPAPGPDSMILLCGPPAMTKSLEATLASMQYPTSAVFRF